MIDSASRGEGETTLFHADGVLVTSERLITGRRTWPLGEVLHVDAIHRAPRVLPLLAILGLGVVLGLPVLIAALAATGPEGKGLYGAALGLTEVVIFGAIVGLLRMEDTYWLVLRTGQRQRRVFHSRDAQLVSRLASVVTEAAREARRRP